MLRKMDSRLLNAFHDDPFDGNYTTFEDTNATDLWSNSNGHISLQLTETLDGILPIRAPQDVNALYNSENSSFLPDLQTVDIKTQQQNNCVDNLSNMVLYQDTAFDVITVDPNAVDYDTNDDDDENDGVEGQHVFHALTSDAAWLDDAASQCSASTFRTRTDSSSIADYESHSSDYDEEDEEGVEEITATEAAVDNELTLPSFIKLDDFMLEKERHDSLNSEIDGFGVNIDEHNFDLADFITKDDFPLEIMEENEKQHDIKNHIKAKTVHENSRQVEKTKPPIHAEDDIIVDVESLEFDSEEAQWILDTRKALAATDDVIQYKDNVKKDPSWIPQKTIKRKEETNSAATKRKTQVKKNGGNLKPKSRLERCSKNLSFIKQQLKANNGYISSPEKKKTVVKQAEVPTVKKVLNLEEYKKRKSGIDTNEANKMTKNHSTEVKEVVKNLREQQQQQQQQPQQLVDSTESCKKKEVEASDDPITIAKNKVLRMQAMKRAKQLKIIDSTISAKVPRVTKMLPLEEMMKANFCASSLTEPSETTKRNMQIKQEKSLAENLNKNTNLVSVTLLSIGCNTIISIPPFAVANLDHNVSRSLLKRVPKMTAHSLLTSIQDVVVQNNLPHTSQLIEIGENKIIMHVPKESRAVAKKNAHTVSVQTEVLPEFPPLMLWPRYRIRHSDNDEQYGLEHEDGLTNHGGYTSSSHASSRRHRSSVSSSYSDSEQVQSYSRKRRTSYKQRRAKKHEPRSLSASSTDSCGSHTRERSLSPERCQRYNSRTRNRANRNVEQPAVEERRIVYVGRIEDETTKEMLRRKFIAYGPIRQITIHYKQTGMKYGFVTYERSQDAFQAIDNADKDPQINMYDISFGGRRAFCRASYADLDNAGINTYESYVFPQVAAPTNATEDSFEQLLQKMKAKMAHSKKDVQTAM